MTRQQSSLTRKPWEAFGQGLARRMTREEAYVAVSDKPNSNAGQLAARKEVEEITLRSGWGETRDVKAMIEDLKVAFDGAVRLGSAAGMAAARAWRPRRRSSSSCCRGSRSRKMAGRSGCGP